MYLFSSCVRLIFSVLPQWSEPQRLTCRTRPESMTTCKESTIIVGGGMVGVSTAYYLASAAQSLAKSHCISVVESSPAVFAAASGGGTGVLGDYGFEPEADELGVLSWHLHKELARIHDGPKNWGYSDIVIQTLHNRTQNLAAKQAGHEGAPLPSWFTNSDDIVANFDYGPDHADSILFGRFLLNRCEALGVRVYINAHLENARADDTGENNVFKVKITQDLETTATICQNIVICAGPWSQRVFESLFPESSYSIPMDVKSRAGNHLRVQTPLWKPEDDKHGTAQLYLRDVLGHSLDISSLLGGTLYIGGYGAEPEELPELATDVHAQPAAIEEMKMLAGRVLNIPEGEYLEILSVGRCYRPFVKHNRPIIAKVPKTKLFPSTSGKEWEKGGVFLNVGHGSDGITLGPGSGKVMSELIMGVRPSVDISGLGLYMP
ncbi:MAG: hypothetical protein Q9217_006020 [Psora testacea]